jgi:hypothetical protein
MGIAPSRIPQPGSAIWLAGRLDTARVTAALGEWQVAPSRSPSRNPV